MSEQVRRIVHDFGLLSFFHFSLTMLDAPLLTVSFHLPFGEMTITLDDVSSLFHLAIASRFFTTPVISQSLACMVVVRDLGVIEDIVLEEFEINRGAHLRISWLQDSYDELGGAHMYETSTRVYMLHLVACTLFADKSHIYIDAQYMWLFTRLDDTS